MIILTLSAAAASAIEMGILFVPDGDPTRVYDGTDTRVFALLIGAALAMALPRNQTFAPVTVSARRLLDALGGVSLLGIFLMFWLTSQYDSFLYEGGMVLLALLTALLVIAVTIHPGSHLEVRPRLGAPPLGGGAVVRDLSVALPGHRADHPAQRRPQRVPGHPADRRHPDPGRPVVALHRATGAARRTRSSVAADPEPPVDLAPPPAGGLGPGRGRRRQRRALLPSGCSVWCRPTPPTRPRRSPASSPWSTTRRPATVPGSTTPDHRRAPRRRARR